MDSQREAYVELRAIWRERPIDIMMNPRRNPERVRCFQIEEKIQLAVMDKDIGRLQIKPLSECQGVHEYKSALEQLVQVEEVHEAIEMRRFDQKNKCLNYDPVDATYVQYKIEVPGIMNKEPALVASDFVLLENGWWKCGMQICAVKGKFVILPKVRLNEYKRYMTNVNVSFVSSGIPPKACEQGLSRCDNYRLETLIFDKSFPISAASFECTHDNSWSSSSGDEESSYLDSFYDSSGGGGGDDSDVDLKIEQDRQARQRKVDELDRRMEKLNPEQRQAVEQIMAPRCNSRPYILFGPPGTGKSHTLVEAVYQLYKRKRKSILVCVNSNTCADDLHGKLAELIHSVHLMRLSAGNKFEFHQERVVVTTNIKSKDVDRQFDYVFIDEAGHANEAETLVPVSNLIENGCLVLAGDPKQLGPVTKCRHAGELGLKHSLLERQFKFDTYKRGGEDNQYNKDYITKLLECYRCDPRVLATSNKLFYDNELKCANRTPRSILNIMHLSNPIQLMPITNGREWRPEGSTSWSNSQEASACVNLIIRLYKMGFEPDQIGVITPYRLQIGELKKTLNRSLAMCEQVSLDSRFRELKLVEVKQRDKDTCDDLIETMDQLKLNDDIDLGTSALEVIDGKKYELKEKKHDWRCKIDTVDGFQGNEREVIIISTVRTSRDERKLDFLNDARRFNVAISRAKWLLIIVGSPGALNLGAYWPELLNESKSELSDWVE